MFKSVSHILPRSLEKMGLKKQTEAFVIIKKSKKVFEDLGLKGIRILFYKDGVLFIESKNHLILNELKYREDEIKEKISTITHQFIRGVKFKSQSF